MRPSSVKDGYDIACRIGDDPVIVHVRHPDKRAYQIAFRAGVGNWPVILKFLLDEFG